MSTDITKRVARGVKWLDRHAPGWEKRVKLREFNIRDECRCVLGQVFYETHGRFSHVVGFEGRKGVISPRHAVACGFTVLHRLGFDAGQHYFSDLQREWKRVIRERKGGTK